MAQEKVMPVFFCIAILYFFSSFIISMEMPSPKKIFLQCAPYVAQEIEEAVIDYKNTLRPLVYIQTAAEKADHHIAATSKVIAPSLMSLHIMKSKYQWLKDVRSKYFKQEYPLKSLRHLILSFINDPHYFATMALHYIPYSDREQALKTALMLMNDHQLNIIDAMKVKLQKGKVIFDADRLNFYICMNVSLNTKELFEQFFNPRKKAEITELLSQDFTHFPQCVYHFATYALAQAWKCAATDMQNPFVNDSFDRLKKKSQSLLFIKINRITESNLFTFYIPILNQITRLLSLEDYEKLINEFQTQSDLAVNNFNKSKKNIADTQIKRSFAQSSTLLLNILKSVYVPRMLNQVREQKCNTLVIWKTPENYLRQLPIPDINRLKLYLCNDYEKEIDEYKKMNYTAAL